MEHYYSFNEYMKERFGCKVYKIAIDGGFTCPNRDGTSGTSGCIFCRNGSGDFCPSGKLSVTRQIEAAKKLVEKKNPGGKYIAYFQSYTGTYDNPERLKKLYTEALCDSEVVALSVATRPDCLGDEVINLLSELNKIKPIIIELGLQTVKNETAEYIRRGYKTSVFDEAMVKLNKAGIETVVHMIAGLPGETKEDMVRTAEHIGRSGAQGIKIQLLHVLEDTDLADEYRKGNVRILTRDEYFDILEECIRVLPPQMVIHRLTGDGSKKYLIEPKWSEDKKMVLNMMKEKFDADNLKQGEKYHPQASK